MQKILLTIFSSTYICETLFSSLDYIKIDRKNRMTNEVSATCVKIKNSNYEADIEALSTEI